MYRVHDMALIVLRLYKLHIEFFIMVLAAYKLYGVPRVQRVHGMMPAENNVYEMAPAE